MEFQYLDGMCVSLNQQESIDVFVDVFTEHLNKFLVYPEDDVIDTSCFVKKKNNEWRLDIGFGDFPYFSEPNLEKEITETIKTFLLKTPEIKFKADYEWSPTYSAESNFIKYVYAKNKLTITKKLFNAYGDDTVFLLQDNEWVLEAAIAPNPCYGLIFAIEGEITEFQNQDELTAYIESNGGKVGKTVLKNTDFVINNDSSPTCTKNKMANKLGVTIITEKEFIEMFGK